MRTTRREMAILNDPVRRQEAEVLRNVLSLDAERPVSQNSSLALEQKQRAEDMLNDQAIAASIRQDIERKMDEKSEDISSAQPEKRLARKIPVLNKKLAYSNSQSLLFKLPSALLAQYILPYLESDSKTLVASALTCPRLTPFFQPLLAEALQARLKPLLEAVVHANFDEAEKIIKANPSLLLHRGTVIDYSGRTIEGTAYQLALGAGDVHRKDCMSKMIEGYFNNLSLLKSDIELEIKKQRMQQFPADFEEKEKQKKLNDSAALKEVINAIGNSKDGNDCEIALNKFREYLKPKNVIKSGKHFNEEMLIEAFNLYMKTYDSDWGDFEKLDLFLLKVIGYIQRFLPACYAQEFCQCIHFANEKRLNRILYFPRKKNCWFFPLDTDFKKRLGFDFLVMDMGPVTSFLIYRMSLVINAFQNLCQAKTLALHNIIPERFACPNPVANKN